MGACLPLTSVSTRDTPHITGPHDFLTSERAKRVEKVGILEGESESNMKKNILSQIPDQKSNK
jgi:hypothetical protein